LQLKQPVNHHRQTISLHWSWGHSVTLEWQIISHYWTCDLELTAYWHQDC